MTDIAGHRQINEDDALRAVVAGTASQTGEGFYRSLVKNMASALDTCGAWVTQFDVATDRLRALAFYFGGQWVEGFEYPIVGTPCETAVRDKCLVHVPDRIIDLYPDDKDPQFAGVVSYLGVPILDDDECVLGHLAVVDNRPMPDEKRLLSLFKIFAERAGAEMRRLRLESAVRAREEQLSRLIDSAMDAIVEIDGEAAITMLNTAAEKLFQCDTDAVKGEGLERLIGAEAARFVINLARDAAANEKGDCHVWVPGPFQVRPPDLPPFQAEASISSYAFRNRRFSTVILRNVEELLRAEKRIESLSAQAEYLRAEIDADHGFDEILGHSPALRSALQSVALVADKDTSVLILGETGTGKELFARAIHKRSRRSDGPMIKVNCAAIPAALIESEFFGHEKGAFTGATQRREGRFALAHGGTIFLDEIGELPLELQGKLLRILQEGEFEPVGSSKTRRVNVRVIAATNRDLEQAVKDGTFREDLYYRLSVFPLRLPPLRERGEDVLVLAEKLIATLSRSMGGRAHALSDASRARLRSYHWPGNVRELRNVIERALITSAGGALDFAHVLPDAAPRPQEDRTQPGMTEAAAIMGEDQLREIERQNMLRALERAGWRVGGAGGAAEMLGIRPSTFKSRMKALGIRRPG
jgi:PAS domain S-box-containing protein